MGIDYRPGAPSARGNFTLDVIVDGEVIAVVEDIGAGKRLGGRWNGVNYPSMTVACARAVEAHQRAVMAWLMNTDFGGAS